MSHFSDSFLETKTDPPNCFPSAYGMLGNPCSKPIFHEFGLKMEIHPGRWFIVMLVKAIELALDSG